MTVKGQKTGLARAEEICRDPAAEARRLKGQGQRIMGYLCCYVPAEILTAAGLVPYRISGEMRRTPTLSDAHLEMIMCSFTRSAFDLALRGGYDFLDGFIVPHACDNIVALYNVWHRSLKPPYSRFLNVPHVVSPAALEFLESEFESFRKSLAEFTGREISEAGLREAVALHNENRGLVRRLYQLSRTDPPRLSGVETTRVLKAAQVLPVEESSKLLGEVIAEVEERPAGPPSGRARIMIHGAQEDDTVFVELVEALGAEVVIDDLCTGTRPFWHDVDPDDPPLRALAERYLDKIYCPRTLRPRQGTRQEDLEARFGHIRELARQWKADGVILHIYRFCDILGFDAPDLKRYLQEDGRPVLLLEDEYNLSAEARLRTRIEAFLEMIDPGRRGEG